MNVQLESLNLYQLNNPCPEHSYVFISSLIIIVIHYMTH